MHSNHRTAGTLTFVLGSLILIGMTIRALGPAFYWALASVLLLAIVASVVAAIARHLRSRTGRSVLLPVWVCSCLAVVMAVPLVAMAVGGHLQL